MTSLPELHGEWCKTHAASWSVVAAAVVRAGAGSLASVGCAMGSVGNMAKWFGRSMDEVRQFLLFLLAKNYHLRPCSL